MKTRSKKGELKKVVRDANRKLKNSVSCLSEEERRRLLSLVSGTQSFRFHSAKHAELDPAIQAWILLLWKRNMEALMHNSHWGFDPTDKADELSAATSRYLVVFRRSNEEETDDEPVAYCHYRFDMDEGEPVLYCYEMQTEADWQSRGIGARLLLILSFLAHRTKMTKIVATVLKANTGSIAFFRRLGFAEDTSNPDYDDDCDYIIISTSVAQIPSLPDPVKVVRFQAFTLDDRQDTQPESCSA